MRVKTFRFWLFIPAILLAFVTIVPAAEDSDSAMREEIKALKKMVLELQERVRELEGDRARPGVSEVPPTLKAAEPEPRKVVPANVSHPEQNSAGKAPIEAEQPVKAKAGTKAPAPLEIGGHPVRVGIAGAIQVDVIHDFNALGLTPGGSVQREFVTADIPVGGPAADTTNRTGFSPSQSYLTGWAETDTPWGPFKVYADVNLFGSSTGTEFQIYKAYGRWGWLKAGLDYTLWLNQAAIPDTLDYEGPNAAPEVRFTQASLKIPLRPDSKKRNLFFTVGVEDAPAEMTLPGAVSTVTSVDQFPSLIGKLSYEPSWAHVELGGLYRRLEAEGAGYDQAVNGWGVTFSGRINTWGEDNFIWAFEYGDALGAYMQDTSGLGLDAAPVSSTNSALNPISAFGAWGAYQHWWSSSLRSTATYGFVHLDSDFDLWPQTAGTGTYKQTQYASLNLIWSPWPPFDVGVEYLFGHRTVTNNTAVEGNTTGYDHRIQCTARWNFDWER